MQLEDLVLVSVDDHVVEPPHLFDDRLPAKYVDLAPKFVTREDGPNAWQYEDEVIGNVALNAGFLVAWMNGKTPEQCLTAGNRVGAATTRQAGGL